MEQFKDNDWDEHGAERDAAEFLEIKKSIFLEDFPMYYAHLFDDDGDDDGEGEIADAKKKDRDEDGEDDDDDDDE